MVKTSVALGSSQGPQAGVELVENQWAKGGVRGTQGAASTAPGHCAGLLAPAFSQHPSRCVMT